MKKIAILLILIFCAAAVFSQEIVGNYYLETSDLEIDIDFYDDEIDMLTFMQIIVTRLVSSQAEELLMIYDELSHLLFEELDTRLGYITDWMDFELAWGYMTPYFAIKYVFDIYGIEYFIVQILPEDQFWFFESVY